jgi:hypothetical protein
LYEFEGPEPLTVKGLRQLTAYRLISKLPQEAAERAEVA